MPDVDLKVNDLDDMADPVNHASHCRRIRHLRCAPDTVEAKPAQNRFNLLPSFVSANGAARLFNREQHTAHGPTPLELSPSAQSRLRHRPLGTGLCSSKLSVVAANTCC